MRRFADPIDQIRKDFDRVIHDITSKPRATTGWEQGSTARRGHDRHGCFAAA
jgi:hypothetical protein